MIKEASNLVDSVIIAYDDNFIRNLSVLLNKDIKIERDKETGGFKCSGLKMSRNFFEEFKKIESDVLNIYSKALNSYEIEYNKNDDIKKMFNESDFSNKINRSYTSTKVLIDKVKSGFQNKEFTVNDVYEFINMNYENLCRNKDSLSTIFIRYSKKFPDKLEIVRIDNHHKGNPKVYKFVDK